MLQKVYKKYAPSKHNPNTLKNPLIFHSHLDSSSFFFIHSPSLFKKNKTNDAS